MGPGEGLTLWTVRLALLLCAAVWTGRLPSGAARLAWTAGCLLYLAHVVCAFHFYHAWSHAAAYDETARRTEELFGLRSGGGLHLNYLFTLLWAGDVLWWWLAPASHEGRPRAAAWALHGYMAFLAFNATVVFGTGPVRWAGLAVCAGVVWCRRSPGPRA